MKAGDKVRLLPPWDEFWPGVHTISEVQAEVVYLEGIEGAFDPVFVEVAHGA